MTKSKSVVIIDDHRVVLEGLMIILKNSNDFELIAAFEDDRSFNDFMHSTELMPDIVIVDAQLGDETNGLELKQKWEGQINSDWVLFSSYVDRYLTYQAKKAGFVACFSKEIKPSVMLNLLKGDLSQFIFYPEDFEPKNSERHIGSVTAALQLLTQREKDVVRVIYEGHSSKKGADILHISPYTFETHKKNIFRKLEINSSRELIRIAMDYQYLL